MLGWLQPPSVFVDCFVLRNFGFVLSLKQASSSAPRAWSTMNDAAREDAFESMRLRLKDMNQALMSMQGVAAVQRSKRNRAETQLEAVVEAMKRMAEEIECS